MIQWLLLLYPEAFRAQFSHDIEADFADLRRSGLRQYSVALAELGVVGFGQRLRLGWPWMAGALVAFVSHYVLYAIVLGRHRTQGRDWRWLAIAGIMALALALWRQRRPLVLIALAVLIAFGAESPGQLLTTIEKRYAKAFAGFHKARSLDDLDRIHRWFDTEDWQSIVNGQPARPWEDLRKYGFKGLWTPEKIEWRITGFRVRDEGAEVEMRIGPFRVVDTWRRTAQGWRRSRHEKFPLR